MTTTTTTNHSSNIFCARLEVGGQKGTYGDLGTPGYPCPGTKQSKSNSDEKKTHFKRDKRNVQSSRTLRTWHDCHIWQPTARATTTIIIANGGYNGARFLFRHFVSIRFDSIRFDFVFCFCFCWFRVVLPKCKWSGEYEWGNEWEVKNEGTSWLTPRRSVLSRKRRVTQRGSEWATWHGDPQN